jgi:two-component system, response regulator, stage 0 sporulation protein F
MVKSTGFAPEPGSFARRRADTILLVDDYADARATLRDLLEDNGHPVIEAANGQQALNILVSENAPRVGLIVLDLQMPVMDGPELINVLRNYVGLASIPVLVVSGHTGQLTESERTRIVGCLQQPYDPKELLGVVNAHVSPATPPPKSA